MQALFRRALIVAGAVGLGAGTIFAQISISPPPGGGGAGSAPETPETQNSPENAQTLPGSAGPDAATQPTAEGVLEALLREKATQGPGASAISGPVAEKNGLLREGELIEMRSGHLMGPGAKATDSNTSAAAPGSQPATPPAADTELGPGVMAGTIGTGMTFVFDHRDGQPDYPSMEVVPSRRLAIMEEASDRGARTVSFRITAEVTQYRGKNYLYVKPSAGGPQAGTPAAASAPATAPATPELAQQLPAAAPNEPAAPRVREEETVEGRLGRLVRDQRSGLEVYEFDADRQKMDDPPLGVIPCKALEVMEDATEGGNLPVKFRLSGEVTQYRGKNYLYVRAFSVIKDMEQGLGG